MKTSSMEKGLTILSKSYLGNSTVEPILLYGHFIDGYLAFKVHIPLGAEFSAYHCM